MSRRAKLLIGMFLVYMVSLVFAVWAVHHQDTMFWKWTALVVGVTGYLTMVIPQIYWLHEEGRY